MVAYILTVVAFAALAAAIPHSHNHFHKHQNLARTGKLAPIAGRSVSYDGSCGSWSGMTCPQGSCCGSNGWCGTGDGFCGAGCQTGFGDCGSSSAPVSVTTSVNAPVAAAASPAASSGSLEVSPDGLCGSDNPYTCKGSNFGDSCSKWGYCGSNSSYSGDGCQSEYGICGQSVAAVSAYAAPSTVTLTTSATSTTSEQADSTDASIADKGGDHHTYGGYTHTTFQTLTKTLPAPSPSSTTEAAPSSPAESSPPANSPAPTPTTTTAGAAITSPSAYTTAEPTSTSAAPSSYSSAAPAPSSTSGGKYIKMYQGDGSSSSGWPSQDSWLSASDLWAANAGILSQSCDYFGVPNDSDAEIESMKKAVASVASSSGVDERFIIAIMLQESNGCVRVPTTVYSHSNPGLFQSHEGTGSCNNGGVQNPCPDSEIEQMVKDGVEGTASGDGLKQLVAACAGKGAQTYYEAARMYNSGSVDPSGNLGLGVATHCYSSDVANRLTGWSEGVSGCDPNTVGA